MFRSSTASAGEGSSRRAPTRTRAYRGLLARFRRADGAGRRATRLVVLATLLWPVALATGAQAANVPTPQTDPFYHYSGLEPLSKIAPGTVLKTRIEQYHIAGVPTSIRVVQLLYRSTSELGAPVVNVTSVLEPPSNVTAPYAVAYQSFYDSLNPDDEPSYAISGGVTLGGLVNVPESALIVPELLKGYAVIVADTEGQNADFAAGPEYGMLTLDSIRAALNSPDTGLGESTKVVLYGYSGGAIATGWAAELAPTYAPDLTNHLVGASMGGVLVDPEHNLTYVSGSKIWAGVIPMAVIGIARAFDIDFTPYLSSYGLELTYRMQKASIAFVLGRYPGLTWAQLAKPQYSTPANIPIYVEAANQLIMGSQGTPKVPLLIAQGANGTVEGTSGDIPGIGPGDGVMVTGDVRSLALEYCQQGVPVQYDEYDNLAHVGTALPWLAQTIPWIDERFAGDAPPQDCATIAPGNPLTPLPVPSGTSVPTLPANPKLDQEGGGAGAQS